jgi:hypothetical protein
MFLEGPMATPIRPGFQAPPQATQRPDAARNNAQRAFFQAAMGNAAAPTATQAQFTAPTPQAQPTQRMPGPLPAEPPTRILRPGSLLDIKV